MLWRVSRSVAIGAWRRARAALGANPLLALGAAACVPVLPLGAALAGTRLAGRFGALASDDAFASALALGLGATGAIAGVTVALAVPPTDALAAPLATAPIRRITLALGATVVPLLALGAAASVPALAFGVAVAGPAGIALVAAFAASALLGAAVAESARAVFGGSRVGVATAGGVAAAWTLAALPWGGAVESGPAAAVVPALTGTNHAFAAVTLAGSAFAAVLLWTAACALPRDERRGRRPLRRDARLPRAALVGLPVAVARTILRHRELRLLAAASVGAPVAAAVGVHATLDVGGEPLVVFALGLTIVAAAVFPSAAQGFVLDARWLVRAAPRSRAVCRAAGAAGGVAIAFGVVAATVGALAPLARADAATLVELEAGVALVFGAAAAGGAVLPWRTGRVVEQLAAYALAIGFAFACWAAAGAILGDAPTAATGALVGNGVLALGLGATALAR